jgi:hypothetical protein
MIRPQTIDKNQNNAGFRRLDHSKLNQENYQTCNKNEKYTTQDDVSKRF